MCAGADEPGSLSRVCVMCPCAEHLHTSAKRPDVVHGLFSSISDPQLRERTPKSIDRPCCHLSLCVGSDQSCKSYEPQAHNEASQAVGWRLLVQGGRNAQPFESNAVPEQILSYSFRMQRSCPHAQSAHETGRNLEPSNNVEAYLERQGTYIRDIVPA